MDLLKLRKGIKSKKPSFLRQDLHKKKRLKGKWRNPKGTDSKMRFGLKGYRKAIKVGWKSPKEVRGKGVSGLNIKLVSSVSDLDKVEPKLDGVVISSRVGKKKRVDLLKKVKETGIKVLNIKNADDYIKKVEDEIKKKKEKKKKASEEKAKKKKEAEEKAKKKEEEGKEKIEDKIKSEEEKEEEKKELDKVLTKK